MSALKGWTSSLKGIKAKFSGTDHQLGQEYVSLSKIGPSKAGGDSVPKWAASISTANALDALPWNATVLLNKRILRATGHALKEGDAIRFESGPNIYQEVGIYKVLGANDVLLDQELAAAPIGSETYTHLRYVTPSTDISGNVTVTQAARSVVDFMDTPFLEAGIITASAGIPLTIVASTAAIIYKVQTIEDIGEFVGLYSDPAGTPVLECILPLAGGEVDVNIPAATVLGLRNMKNAAIDLAAVSSALGINFIG